MVACSSSLSEETCLLFQEVTSGSPSLISFHVVMFLRANWSISIVYGSLYDKLNFTRVLIGFYETCYLHSVARYDVEVCVSILPAIVFKKIKFFVASNSNLLELSLFVDLF